MLNFAHESAGFSLFGINITYYGIIISIAFIVAILLAIYTSKKRGIKSDDIITLALYVIPLSILGARTYFVIFSGYSYSFLEFFEIWNGGMAILGGVIGGVIGVLLYSFIHKKNFLTICDVAAPSLIIGQAIGRIGCYFAGCCYGIETTDPALQWFPFSVQIEGVWHLSTMFYESLWCFICFFVVLYIFKKFKTNGVATCSYLILYGVGRAIIETFRGESLYLFSTGIKVSQALAILIAVVGIIGLILIYTKKKKSVRKSKNEKIDIS